MTSKSCSVVVPQFTVEANVPKVEVPLNDRFGDADESDSAIQPQCRSVKEVCGGVK